MSDQQPPISSDLDAGIAQDKPSSADRDTTLRPPQFTLRGLLIGTAGVAMLLSVMLTIGSFWAIGVSFLLVLMAAHVAGNSVGTRLRDGGSRPRTINAAASGARVPTQVIQTTPTRLGERRRLHWINPVLTLVGAVVASYFGGRGLASIYPDATTSAVVLAHISSGVLGGFAVFVVASFLSVLRQTLSEAHAGSDQYRPAERRQANSSRPQENERHPLDSDERDDPRGK